MREWVPKASEELLRLRNNSGVWGYRKDRDPSVEATALAGLGLLSSCPYREHALEGISSAIHRAANWLVSLQQRDGSIGVSPSLPRPGWATPYAIQLWAALDAYGEERRRAIAWVLEQKGMRLPAGDRTRSYLGHDPSLEGWPWIDNTHSWLEPTAQALLAMSRESLNEHPRAIDGFRLIIDRALPRGGWNYGNKSVFGRELRPQPAPTGLALLALATTTDDGCRAVIDPAIAYLQRVLLTIRAPISLGWSVLGLRAWNAAAPETESLLSQSYASIMERPDSAPGLGLLLLAAADRPPAFAVDHDKSYAGARGSEDSQAQKDS
jgi:hypothetical protein